MRKNLRAGRLRSGRRYSDINPMDGMGNLADAMLVFACGLLLSLIINWNVDVSQNMVEMERGQDMSQVQEIVDDITQDSTGNQYEKMGVVYRDPVTGKLYMLSQE